YGAEFLFIHDLTGKATGGELIALLILYVGTQLLSGFFMSVTADKSQRTMMFLLPLIFVPFILNFPAGLILYWITTNIWTIGQGLAIKRLIPVPVAATPEGAAAIQAAKPPPPPPRKKKKRR
ncbi:MAG: YidC/Oxa1 family membrane protein insertase, partial [Solirubrobacterales bacterium]